MIKAFKISTFLLLIAFLSIYPNQGIAQGYLKAKGKYIVNEEGKPFLFKSIGLGGWMLQEGYMLRLSGEGQQHKIKERITSVIGKERTEEFYKKWLENHVRKVDIDSLKAWGFNAIRLPMHYRLFTLSIEEEPKRGENTWLKKGFDLTDSLLNWCKANQIYLVLDLHAAPGGQGNDFNISDRDSTKPSLWESKENQKKMIALWKEFARRYVNESWIGGYDIINEPNWGFTDPSDKNGLKELKNEPLKNLLIEITNAIREEDKKHMIIIEGNGWGNNYRGIDPTWDNNLVLSFHKYWNYNDQASIQGYLNLREKYQIPLYLGETGENSNVWFTQAVRLAEANQIGWAWWPLKKIGINNPLEIKMPDNYQQLLDYWSGKANKPEAELAYRVLMQLAEKSKLENCFQHKDVVDALFRQPYTAATKPFSDNTIFNNKIIKAVDYDLGRNGEAYFDMDTINYHISDGGKRGIWNKGRTYRNDGVDIELADGLSNDYHVFDMQDEEWLQYTVYVPKNEVYNVILKIATSSATQLLFYINGQPITVKEILNSDKSGNWQEVKIKNMALKKGENKIRLFVKKGNIKFDYLKFLTN